MKNNIKKNLTALLPMKGHSERVPSKNLKLFNGIPLFHHILKSLIQSDLISKIIINTDSSEIAESALKFEKVVIHTRPKEICGDFVSMNEIIKYDLEKSDDTHYFQTHSTNPLLETKSINKAIETYFNKIKETDIDSIYSVTKIQSRFNWSDGKPINHDPNELIRTQDLEPIYEENSNLFIFSKDSFKKAKNKRIGLNPFMFETKKIESLDIDELEDFLIAEAIHKLNLVNK